MTGKLVDDLFITTTDPAIGVYYSSPVPMGGDNGAMVDLWVKSVSGAVASGGIKAIIEGSNDGNNFDTTAIATAQTATGPAWVTDDPAAVIPWAWLRLRIEIKSTATGNTGSALVSASIRTYRMS